MIFYLILVLNDRIVKITHKYENCAKHYKQRKLENIIIWIFLQKEVWELQIIKFIFENDKIVQTRIH